MKLGIAKSERHGVAVVRCGIPDISARSGLGLDGGPGQADFHSFRQHQRSGNPGTSPRWDQPADLRNPIAGASRSETVLPWSWIFHLHDRGRKDSFGPQSGVPVADHCSLMRTASRPTIRRSFMAAPGAILAVWRPHAPASHFGEMLAGPWPPNGRIAPAAAIKDLRIVGRLAVRINEAMIGYGNTLIEGQTNLSFRDRGVKYPDQGRTVSDGMPAAIGLAEIRRLIPPWGGTRIPAPLC